MVLKHRPSVEELSYWLSGVEDAYPELEKLSEDTELALETSPRWGTFLSKHCE
jgi:hypothetical protein